MELMKSSAISARILLFFCVAWILVHLGVITRLVPDHIVWGGRIPYSNRLVRMEAIAILPFLLLILLVSWKEGWIAPRPRRIWIQSGLWMMVLLFGLSTLGNALAQHPLERYGFGAVSLLMVFLLVLVIRKN
jgi:hypothetical protein